MAGPNSFIGAAFGGLKVYKDINLCVFNEKIYVFLQVIILVINGVVV